MSVRFGIFIIADSVTSGSQTTSSICDDTPSGCSASNDTGAVIESNTDDGVNIEDYCNGIRPITIEPDANGIDEDDDDHGVHQPLPTSDTNTNQPAVSSQAATSAAVSSPQSPDVQVLYCGTLAGNSMLAPGVISELAQNLVAGFRHPQSVAYLNSIAANCSKFQNKASSGSSNSLPTTPTSSLIAGCCAQKSVSCSSPVSLSNSSLRNTGSENHEYLSMSDVEPEDER